MLPQSGSTSLHFGLVLLLLHVPSVHNGFACLSNPCIHGVCLDDLNSTYFCYCIDGYTGLQCQTNWNDCWSSPCQNGGSCIDGIATFNCTCPSGFIGDLCEEDFNECESNPCWNNGTCVDGPNGYNCQCLPGYSGIHCEVDIAVCNTTEEARCQNGGVCEEGPGDTFSCRCQPGWDGFLCGTEVDECMSAPCQNGAVCIDLHANYECACLFGFTGRNCEEIIRICDKNPCKNGALCLIEDTMSICYCVPDFHGDMCQLQYDECQLGPKCSNGGTCIDGIDNFTCSCPPNLTGVLCECLLLPDNLLDCSYVSPSTTTESYPNATIGTTLKTESTTPISDRPEKSTTEPELFTTIIQVPNITTVSTETTTVPYCITQTASTKTPATVTYTATTIAVPTESFTSTTLSTSSEFPSTLPTAEVTDLRFTNATTTATGTTTEMATWASSDFTTGIERWSTEKMSTTAEIETSSPILTTTSERTTLSTTIPSTDISSITTTTGLAETSHMTTVYPETTSSQYTETDVTEFPIYSTHPTAFETTTTSSHITEAPSKTSTELLTTTDITHTVPSNTTVMPTTETTAGIVTETTLTTTLPTITTEEVIKSTTEKAKESNRTFPEELSTTTLFPPVTTFFTDQPGTDYTVWTDRSITPTTESTTISGSATTLEPSLLTTSPSIDCTLPDQRCRNGGTCIFTEEEFKCVCPFDSEGDYCENKLGIKNAAFNGNSYLSHRLPENQNISVEFEARTLSSTGLLLHVHLDKTYMALYVENGFLMFKFSCGYQTMLLSELKVPVNNGLSMNIKANLEFSKDFKHCDAQIKVNDTLSMTGDQMAKIETFVKSTTWLHLGGIPNDILYDNVPTGGFIGCMSNLKISGKKVYIYKDADDGFEISECSSLACLSNPCKNGALCSSQGDMWSCHCRNGFLGKMCEISICDNNPCLFGGTCIPFSSSGYICLCPYGKHGHFCENDLKINEPYFSSTVRGLSSFIAYPLPEGISQKMEIKFRFTPTMMEQISILLFIGQSGQHDLYSDHLAVSFVKGFIMLTWNMGSGPRRIFTSQPIENGARDYFVQVGYDSRRAWLSVDSLGNVTGRSPGTSVQLDIMPLLYLGGHDSRNFSTLPHDLPLHTGFSGCIFDVEVKIGTIVIPLQGTLKAVGRAVGQCGTTECYERSCQNGGACLHHGSTFMCLCQDRWYGPLCSSKMNLCDTNVTTCSVNSRCVPLLTNFECDCSFGRVGKNCETGENITDISFTGVRSFLSTYPFEIDSSKFNIEMEIRMLKDTGIILFMGRKGSSFVCLSIQSGLLELKVHSSKIRASIRDPLTVRSSKLLLKGVWHKVQFGVFGRKVFLYVDHIINMGILDHGFMLSLPNESINLDRCCIFNYINIAEPENNEHREATKMGPIFMTLKAHIVDICQSQSQLDALPCGLDDMSKLPTAASSSLPIPYTGCLRHLSIDERKVPLTRENILSSRNVIDCDGTPCGGEACLNGGTCWLDSLMSPHCACIEPYYGEKCEFVPKCTGKNCRNGICENSTCTCHIGFDGGFCETEIEVKTPAFVGKSYLIVQKLGDKKRNIRNLEIKNLYLNFTTAKNNGLLVWSRRDKNFLGLGIDKGYLKIVYSPGVTHQQIVEIAPYYKMSDGLWHNLVLSFSPLLLRVDDKIIKLSVNQKEVTQNRTVSTNGVFFIGGLPINTSLVKETNGMFPHSFEGCIEAFGTNTEKVITNFMPFEGANIDNCNVF